MENWQWLVGLAAWLLTCNGAVGLKGGPPQPGNIERVIIHTISGPQCLENRINYSGAEGDAQYWHSWFEKHPFLSIHYVIDRSGMTMASTPEEQIARHAADHNDRTIGIELVHSGDGVEEFSEAQIGALIALLRDINRRHAIPANKILGHSDVDNRYFTCGAEKVKLKQDPGTNFPWARIRTAM